MNAFVSCSTVGIPGVNHRFAAKLSAHGVRTRLELANLCDDDDRCLDIALRSGLSSGELKRLAKRAQLLNLSEMTPDYLHLLIEAGITSVDELAASSSPMLRERLTHVAAFRPQPHLPSPMTLLGWIAEARLQSTARAA